MSFSASKARRLRSHPARLAASIRPVIESLESRTLLSLSLIKDINPATGSATTPSSLVDVGGTLFFVVGSQLWKSDGTIPGTAQISTTATYPSALTNVNGQVYFLSGGGLWKSDGTAGGTVQVSPSVPGAAELTNVNGALYFRATDGAGAELWRSDGTAGGTGRVKDINPGSGSSDPRGLTNVNGTLFFHASDGTSGDELWMSNGTDAGTVRVKDINPGSSGSGPLSLTNVNGTLFFVAHNADNSGYELWSSNGTDAGTAMVKDIRPGLPGSSPTLLRSVNGKLLFVATDGQNGYELWSSDGTPGGTAMVTDIIPGGASPNIDNLTVVGNQLYFTANDGVSGTELWHSDGSAAGTGRVKDIRSGPLGSDTGQLVAGNGKVFFTANDGTHGQELWVSDGTDAGTSLVMDVNPGTFNLPFTDITTSGSKVFFVCDNGSGRNLWVSNGTTAGTQQFAPFLQLPAQGSDPSTPVRINGILYFAANDGTHGTELWKSDGTAGGTTMVADLRPGVFGSNPTELVNFNGALYFTINGQLYTSDGSAAGTIAVSPAVMSPSKLTPIGNTLYFVGNDGGGAELWKSDGTAAGTVRLQDIQPGPGSSSPDSLTNVSGTLMFTADDGTSGIELWKSNGTPGGTTRIADIRPGAASSGPALLTNVNGLLYFRATDGVNGYELWKSDGTPGGTSMVKDIRPGAGDAYIRTLAASGSNLFFVADDGVHGEELWKSDGTPGGTSLVSDVHAGPQGSTPMYLMNVGGTFYFRADDGIHGEELWKSDGTQLGTVMVKEIHPGPDGADISRMFDADGTLIFFARQNDYSDVWTSDGTDAGTYALNYPGQNLHPAWFSKLNGVQYFAAWRADTGQELWSMPITPPPAGAVATAQKAQTSAAATATTQAAAAQASGDIFYNASLRADPPLDAATSGLAGITVDYGQLSADYNFDFPSESAARALARKAAALNQPLVFDIERWGFDNRYFTEAVVQMNLEKLEHIIDWAHDERPGLQVGFYGTLPVDQYPTPGPNNPGYAAWHAANERIKPAIDRADILLPSTYAGSADTNLWRSDLEGKVSESRLYGKTVRPFLWPQYFGYPGNATTSVIPGAFWRLQLDETAELADGAAIWDSGPAWQIDEPWWTITRDFLIDSTPIAAAKPTALNATPISTSRIDLTWWDQAYNETGYRIERRSGTDPFTPVTTVGRDVTQYSDTGLSGSVTYTYRVIAVNAAGDSLPSNEASATTADVVPVAPTNLSAVPLSISRVQLQWTDNSANETGFVIERAGPVGGFIPIDSVGANVTSFTDTGLTPGTTYTYRVHALNSAGSSATTAQVPATTLQTNSGLVGLWRLDEGSGTTTSDSSGGSHGGNLVNGPVWTSGQLGSALTFDGVNDRVEISDSPSMRFTIGQSFTLSAWVNVTSLPGHWSGVVTKSRGSAPWYGIWIDDTNHWQFGGAGNLQGSLVTTGWTLVTAVQDGTALTRKLYINGALVASGGAWDGSGTGALWIGGSEGAGEFFAGSIDDVRLYGRALPAGEVAALAAPHVALAGTGSNDNWTVRLDPTGGQYEFLLNGTINFTRPIDTAATIDFAAGDGNDQLTLDFTNGDPLPTYGLNFDGGAGTDTLQIQGGGASLALTGNGYGIAHGALSMSYGGIENLSVAGATLSASADLATNLTIQSQGVLVFNADQHLPSLTIASGGVARLASAGNRLLVTPSLSIAPGGSLDLRDNKLIVHAPVGSWNGTVYTGLAGMVQSGRNGGAWNGSGIVSTDPRALGSSGAVALATLAVVKFGTVRNIADNQTALFAGQSLFGSDTVIMLTYAGDTTLDGKINIDDYIRMDLAVASSGSDYYNGDLNLDGKVNIDDYVIIDSNIPAQGAAFSTAELSFLSASSTSNAWDRLTSDEDPDAAR